MSSKLLIVTTVSGTVKSILRDQPRFLNSYFSVSIACSLDNDSDSLRNEGVDVYDIPMRRRISPFYDVYSLFSMISLILKLKPDIVHSYTPKAGLIAMLSSFLCNVPKRIHTFTGLIWPTSCGINRYIIILVDKLICACASNIVPEGNGVKRDMLQAKITKKTLNVIGYGNIAGVDLAFFNPFLPHLVSRSRELLSSYCIDDTAFVFIFLGRLNSDKGIYELYNAFITLPNNAHLLILGNVDTVSPVDNALLETMKSHSRVHLIGYQSDIRPYLLSSHVLVLPSYREGFPNVVLQAGAMCLPSIVTDVNGSNEIVDDGFNGLIVPPRNVNQLASAMLSMLNTSSEDLRKLGTAARMRIITQFNRTSYWKMLLNFYKSL